MKVFDRNIRIETVKEKEEPQQQPAEISETDKMELQIKQMQDQLEQKKKDEEAEKARLEEEAKIVEQQTSQQNIEEEFMQQNLPQQSNIQPEQIPSRSNYPQDDKTKVLFRNLSLVSKTFILFGVLAFIIWLLFIFLMIFSSQTITGAA